MKSRFSELVFAMFGLLTVLVPSLALADDVSSLPLEEGLRFGLVKDYGAYPMPNDDGVGFSKVYANPDQVELTHDGVFYRLSEEEVTPVSAVAADSTGLYVILGGEQVVDSEEACGE